MTNLPLCPSPQSPGYFLHIVTGSSPPHSYWNLLKCSCRQRLLGFLHAPLQSSDLELASLDEGGNIKFASRRNGGICRLDGNISSILDFGSLTRFRSKAVRNCRRLTFLACSLRHYSHTSERMRGWQSEIKVTFVQRLEWITPATKDVTPTRDSRFRRLNLGT